MKTDYDPLFKWRYINYGEESAKEKIKKIKSKNNSAMKQMHESYHKQFKLIPKEINTTNSNFKSTFTSDLLQTNTKSGFFSQTNYFSTSYINPTIDHYITTSYSINNLTQGDFHKISPNRTSLFIKNFSIGNSNLSGKDKTNLYEEKDLEPLTKLYHMNESEKVNNKLSLANISKDEEDILFKKFNIRRDEEEGETNEIRHNIKLRNYSKLEKATEKFNKHEARCVDYYYDDPITSKNKLKLNNEIFTHVMHLRSNQQQEKYENILGENFVNFVKLAQMPKIKEIKVEKNLPNLPLNKKLSKKQYMKFNDSNSPEKLSTRNDEAQVDTNLINSIEDKQYIERLNRKPKKEQMISREHLLESILLNCFTVDAKFKPNSRSLFSLNIIKDKLILFGGLNSNRLNDIWVCEIENKFKWEKLTIDEKVMPTPRHGHTSCLYKNELYIYGGSTPINYYHTPEDMVVFSLSIGSFYTPVVLNKSEILWRRDHVAVTVGNFMFVHGGISNDEKLLSDCHIFEFSTRRWYVVDIKGQRPPGLAYHNAELVVGFDTKKYSNYNIYRLPELPSNTNKITKIKRQGIFLFGGMDENRNYTNEIRILKIGRKPTKWLFPNTHGIPPTGRINATMNFYSDLNILIIHGGRNDKERVSIFGDLFIFDLEKFNWIKVDKFSTSPVSRTEHNSVIYEDKLIILGGNNLSNLVKFDFFMVSLDLYSNKKMSTIVAKQKIVLPEYKKQVTMGKIS